MAAVKPDLYRYLHSLGNVSIVDVVDNYLLHSENPALATMANGEYNLAQSGIYAANSTEHLKPITTQRSSTACDAASTADLTFHAHFAHFQFRNIYNIPNDPPYYAAPESAVDPIAHVFGRTDILATTAHVMTKNATHVTYQGGVITLLLAGDVTPEIMTAKG